MTVLPRVSTILAILYPNSLDFVWQADLERGTALHLEMEIWVNNHIHGFVEAPLSPACQPVANWLFKERVEFEATEALVSHKYGFEGHPDLLATWDIPFVFDYKFAQQLTEQNSMQMEAYTRATGRRGCFLQCSKDGTVRAKRHKKNDALWNAFLAGLNVWKFRNARKPAPMSQAELDEQLAEIKEKLAYQTENYYE